MKGNAAKSLTWKAACQKLGVRTITERGANDPRNPRGLINAGVGGVQIADVSVDIETGMVKINRIVAVQDFGLVINPKLADSQILGAIIMNICAALMEERVMDEMTGQLLNADMEFYKLAGIADIGEIDVHLDITPDHDKRGVVGLGEPPAVPGLAAIANAVTNAIGVRVPTLPLHTAQRVGRPQRKEDGLKCKPSNMPIQRRVKEAVALLGSSWNDAQVLAGGTDLISLMKEYLHTPNACS